jgi:hypothetical protein
MRGKVTMWISGEAKAGLVETKQALRFCWAKKFYTDYQTSGVFWPMARSQRADTLISQAQ